ncbi:hypothetical protein MYP14_06205 [Rhodococcus pyridinivorans]|uniref:hypothetical protein n=1 Tax=Rhodococcus pyridinivorans TaxID=103816 RepID=UPI0020005968|nr:hypothetical protein [Rhodococcus pyridinivorans]UPK64941.1 hypothetical protein MYP14_06205 [Rhodococcus pyridinivorans]
MMLSRDELADLIADRLMPAAAELVMGPAIELANAILEGHVVAKLPESSHIDEHGVSWCSADGRPLATVANEDVWAGDDILDADAAEGEGLALLAAARAARAFQVRLP